MLKSIWIIEIPFILFQIGVSWDEIRATKKDVDDDDDVGGDGDDVGVDHPDSMKRCKVVVFVFVFFMISLARRRHYCAPKF